MYALGESGRIRNDPRMLKAAEWILEKQVRNKGDWAVKNPERRSRAAGTSSSTMSSTPMLTIPPGAAGAEPGG